MPVTFQDVRKIALSLGDIEETTSYGTPAFRLVNGPGFLRLKEDGDSLVVRCDFDQREALVAEDPEVYYFTDHYLKYEWVLVRLSKISREAIRDVIRMAHRKASADGSKKRGTKRKRSAWS